MFNPETYLNRNKNPSKEKDLGISEEDFQKNSDELETILKEEGKINSVHYEISISKKSHDSSNK
jgi:hypothetical protein